MEARINSAKTNQNQASPAMCDGVSLVLFNGEVIVPFVNMMLQNQASGGPTFDLAIQKAGLLITAYFDPTK